MMWCFAKKKCKKKVQFYPKQIQRGDTAKYGDEVIANGFYNVDTFFFMSGLLVAYLAFIELEKKRYNLVRWLAMFYILRYIRSVSNVA